MAEATSGGIPETLQCYYHYSKAVIETDKTSEVVFTGKEGSEIRRVTVVKSLVGKNVPKQVLVMVLTKEERAALDNATVFLTPTEPRDPSLDFYGFPKELRSAYTILGAIPLTQVAQQTAWLDYLRCFQADDPYTLLQERKAWVSKYREDADRTVAE